MVLTQINKIKCPHRRALEGNPFIRFIDTPLANLYLIDTKGKIRSKVVKTTFNDWDVSNILNHLEKGYLAVIYPPNDYELFWVNNQTRVALIQLTYSESTMLNLENASRDIKITETLKITKKNKYKYLVIR